MDFHHHAVRESITDWDFLLSDEGADYFSLSGGFPEEGVIIG